MEAPLFCSHGCVASEISLVTGKLQANSSEFSIQIHRSVRSTPVQDNFEHLCADHTNSSAICKHSAAALSPSLLQAEEKQIYT